MVSKHRFWFDCLRGDKLKEGKLLNVLIENTGFGNHIFSLKPSTSEISNWDGIVMHRDYKDYIIQGLRLPIESNYTDYNVGITAVLAKCNDSKCKVGLPWIRYSIKITVETKDPVPESYFYSKDLKNSYYGILKCNDIEFPIKRNINFYHYNRKLKKIQFVRTCKIYIYSPDDHYCTWAKAGNVIAEKSQIISRPLPPPAPTPNSYATLWGFGRNDSYQLGNGNSIDKSSPVQTIIGTDKWKEVACGVQHASGIKTNGTLWCWGSLLHNQLGNNKSVDINKPNEDSFVKQPVQTCDKDFNWDQVSCGSYHTAGIKKNGTLWTWGLNLYGELGNGWNDYRTGRSSPTQTIAFGNNWKQVSCGHYITAAVKTNGTLWVWGSNISGFLWTNSGIQSLGAPFQTKIGGDDWDKVFCGYNKITAIKKNGTLWNWGLNYQKGQDDGSPKIRQIGTGWDQISLGKTHTAAIKKNGTLWCWGTNGFGQFGNNQTSNQETNDPVRAIGNNWSQVSCGATYTIGIKKDGTLWSWGRNLFGELGQNQNGSYSGYKCSSPVQVTGNGSSWFQSAASFEGYTTFAIKT